jgi:hypothetical protein
MSSAPPSAPGVAFDVERFEWASDDRLEVVGRWFGLRGHRFLRPTLDVEVRGERRRMLAVLDHKPWAAEDGEEWIAAFAWTGERAPLDDAELTVSPDLAVQLPLPDASSDGDTSSEPAVPAGERRPARRPRTAVLEDELAAARAEVGRRDEELAQVRQMHSEATRELRERARLAQERTRELESELDKTREALAAAEADAQRERAVADEKARRELERLREEHDAALTERDRATTEAAEARVERDAAVKGLSAAEAERDALTEARDRAREERNAWMSRARATAAEARGVAPIAERLPAPPRVPPAERLAAPPRVPPAAPAEPADSPTERIAAPPGERRTIQIGERPGPLRAAPPAPSGLGPSGQTWTPRLIAAVALAAFVIVAVLLLLLAL